jgi:hypothetical protein
MCSFNKLVPSKDTQMDTNMPLKHETKSAPVNS